MIIERFKYLITLIFISLVFIPIAEVFEPPEIEIRDGNWKYVFVYDDLIAMTLYSGLFLSWILYLFKRNTFSKIILGIFSLLNLALNALAITIPAQDFNPLWGILVCILLSMCIFVQFLLDYLKKSTPANTR